jgi:hypothetical protein
MGLWSRDGECPYVSGLATKVNPGSINGHCQWRATGPSGEEIAADMEVGGGRARAHPPATSGAEDGIRTRDFLLGKEMLYH